MLDLGSSGHTCGLATSPDSVVLDDMRAEKSCRVHAPSRSPHNDGVVAEASRKTAKQPRAQRATQPERILAPRRDVVSSSGAIGSSEIPTIPAPRISGYQLAQTPSRHDSCVMTATIRLPDHPGS